ncbi:ribosomal protein S18-alanine N-acetyltransferase [uncultured Psychrobacter sp.]|uniref:ribosomal protein S18-alanine N-acetyltransferase n=1 Tax=uncultured Psychrobacter sp. TaxID=259303 RepID=UPI00260CA3EA|nr:ribosomal protein S18-alanine N-acetyltransferase [uncultured Psychrobacter sp.]
MFTIQKLSDSQAFIEQVIQAIATIETQVQSQDAWTYKTLVELFEQDSIDIIVVYDELQEKKTDHKKVVGYCLYQVMFEQAEILRIGTHPDYQRQGIASRIFATLETELLDKQVESLLLEVRADNAPAIALYKQQKFINIHKRQGYYHIPNQPAIDALIMQRVYN